MRHELSTTLNHLKEWEYKNTLSDPQWLPLPGAESLEATGSLTTFTDSFNPASIPQRFYQLRPLD